MRLGLRSVRSAVSTATSRSGAVSFRTGPRLNIPEGELHDIPGKVGPDVREPRDDPLELAMVDLGHPGEAFFRSARIAGNLPMVFIAEPRRGAEGRVASCH